MKVLSSAIIVLIALHTTPALCEEVTYSGVIREALLKGPMAAEIDAALAARTAEAYSVQMLENPTLDISSEIPVEAKRNDGVENESISVVLSQSLRASDFGARRAVSKLIDESSQVEKVIAVRGFVQNVSTVYAGVWQQQLRQNIYEDARKRVQGILQTIAGNPSGGLLSPGDVELLKAEAATFEAETLGAKADVARAIAELTALTAIDFQQQKLTTPPLELKLSKDRVIALARESKLPIQQRYKQLSELAQKEFELAQSDSTPAITPRLGYSRHDDGYHQVVVGVSVPLPLFNRNQAGEARAAGAREAAERSAAYGTSDALVSEVSLLFDAYATSRKQLSLYDTSVIPAKTRALEAYSKQFAGGVGTVFQIGQALRELTESQLREIELKGQLFALKARIDALIGKE